MITLNKLIYDMRNTRFGGISADEYNISNRQWAFWIGTVRGKLIEERIERKGNLEPFKQTIECVKMECIDLADQWNKTKTDIDKTGMHIYRSEVLPPVIPYTDGHFNMSNVFTSVKTLTGDPIEITSEEAVKFAGHSKYSKHLRRGYYKTDRIYLINSNSLEFISISGIFSNPADLAAYNNLDGSPCYTNDSPYPITDRMVTALKDIVFDKYVRRILENVDLEDTRNDANIDETPGKQLQTQQ